MANAIQQLQSHLAGYKEDVVNIALLGGSAAAGMVAAELALKKLPWVKDKLALYPNWQGPIMIGAGIVGGIAISRFVKGGAGAKIGAGVATGLVGWGVATVLKWVLNKYVFQEAPLTGWGQIFSGAADFAAFGQSRRDEDLLLGLSAIKTEIRDVKTFPGYTPTEGVRFGQPVEVRDIRPVPGMSGFSSGTRAAVAG